MNRRGYFKRFGGQNNSAQTLNNFRNLNNKNKTPKSRIVQTESHYFSTRKK